MTCWATTKTQLMVAASSVPGQLKMDSLHLGHLKYWGSSSMPPPYPPRYRDGSGEGVGLG